MDEQIIFKIIVLGQQGVGKSAMLLRYMKGQFSSQYTVTIGVEFASKNIPVDNNKQVKLQIWDTAGQEAFKAIVRSFYKGIAAVFLTFALNNEESLDGLKAWQKEVRENGHQEIIFILVGTKSDMGKPQLAEKAQRMLRELEGAFFIETSAKTNQNIEQLFQMAAEIMYKKYVTNEEYRCLVNPSNDRSRQRTYSLAEYNKESHKQKKKSKCCQ